MDKVKEKYKYSLNGKYAEYSSSTNIHQLTVKDQSENSTIFTLQDDPCDCSDTCMPTLIQGDKF